MGRTMTTRDRIEASVKALLTEIAKASDDEDVTELARVDCRKLERDIGAALAKFNKFEGWGDGGPTQADVKGEVTHDIG